MHPPAPPPSGPANSPPPSTPRPIPGTVAAVARAWSLPGGARGRDEVQGAGYAKKGSWLSSVEQGWTWRPLTMGPDGELLAEARQGWVGALLGGGSAGRQVCWSWVRGGSRAEPFCPIGRKEQHDRAPGATETEAESSQRNFRKQSAPMPSWGGCWLGHPRP